MISILAAQVNVHEDYAVGWITLALINAGLAQSKGKSGLLWGLLSLLLGPITTFIIVVFLEKETSPGQPTSSSVT